MTTPPTHKQLGALERRRNARGAALARMVQPPTAMDVRGNPQFGDALAALLADAAAEAVAARPRPTDHGLFSIDQRGRGVNADQRARGAGGVSSQRGATRHSRRGPNPSVPSPPPAAAPVAPALLQVRVRARVSVRVIGL